MTNKIKLSLALLGTAGLFACQQAPTQSTITGTAPEALEGKYVYLLSTPTKRGEEPTKLDSALVEKSLFAFAPRAVDSLHFYLLEAQADSQEPIRLGLTLEVGNIVVNLTEQGEDAKPIVEGKLNLAYRAYQQAQVDMVSKVKKELESYDKEAADYQAKTDSLITKYGSDVRELYKASFAANANNVIGADAFVGLLQDTELTKEQFEQYKSQAGEGILNHTRTQKVIKALEAQFTVVAGTKFVDFDATTPAGEATKFSQYVGNGHYTIVDFWASWCGPCRRAMPELIKLYEQYGPKGLQILGVFVWDEVQNLEPAVKELGLPWTQIVSETAGTEAYGVQGIPHLMLIGPDGTIVARGIHGYEEISKLLEQELQKNGGAL